MNKELITALVDNELIASQKAEVLSAIETDKNLMFDYRVQLLMKNIVREKVKFKTTPVNLRNQILKKIQPRELTTNVKQSFFANLFAKPAFSFASAVILVLAIVLILFNRPTEVEPRNYALEQLGSDNMFVQAKNNFASIVQGKLAPQLVSGDAKEIDNFFRSKGVKYSTVIPEFNNWTLLGAVVSEDKGEKFAHHVYSGKGGELIYVFQVDESYLQSHQIISLTDDLLSYLDGGNCYTTENENSATLLTKSANNICAIVSNLPLEELRNNFCNFN